MPEHNKLFSPKTNLRNFAPWIPRNSMNQQFLATTFCSSKILLYQKRSSFFIPLFLGKKEKIQKMNRVNSQNHSLIPSIWELIVIHSGFTKESINETKSFRKNRDFEDFLKICDKKADSSFYKWNCTLKIQAWRCERKVENLIENF